MDLTDPGLCNDYIALERLDEIHREPLRVSNAVEFMWLSLPAVQRGAGFDAYFDHILSSAKKSRIIPFALRDPQRDGRFVGVTAFIDPDRTHRRVNIGYTWIEPYLRGKGIYSAIQRLMIQRALDWGARRIGWPIESENTRAIRAVESIGAIREGTLRSNARFADGQWVDITICSMLRDEAKAALLRLDEAIAAKQA
ncbi:MAG: GNAT family N-acetyltransferase [Henriciella sp.]